VKRWARGKENRGVSLTLLPPGGRGAGIQKRGGAPHMEEGAERRCFSSGGTFGKMGGSTSHPKPNQKTPTKKREELRTELARPAKTAGGMEGVCCLGANGDKLLS